MTSFFRGLGDTRDADARDDLAVMLQAVLAYALIFGRLGLPACGATGAGRLPIAESVVAAILFGFLFRRTMRAHFATRRPARSARIRRFLARARRSAASGCST